MLSYQKNIHSHRRKLSYCFSNFFFNIYLKLNFWWRMTFHIWHGDNMSGGDSFLAITYHPIKKWKDSHSFDSPSLFSTTEQWSKHRIGSHPCIAFEHLSLYIYRSILAVKGILWTSVAVCGISWQQLTHKQSLTGSDFLLWDGTGSGSDKNFG